MEITNGDDAESLPSRPADRVSAGEDSADDFDALPDDMAVASGV